MSSIRLLAPHALALVVASGVAAWMWTRGDEPRALVEADVTVWTGRADQITRIAFEGKNRKVSIEAKKDERGRYFVGTSERESIVPPMKEAAPEADGGAPAPAPEPKRTTQTLLSVGGGQKLAEALAPLKALRDVGKVLDDRAAEFGFDKPEGTLRVTIAGAERTLVFGGPTPGGSDRYAKDPSTGEAYALSGEIFRDLDSPDARLFERDLHEFKDADVQRAHVTAGDKKRDLVHGGADRKRTWADPATPDQNDETLGNWMAKLDRLRPTEYVTTPPEGRQTVVRVEYAGSSPLGYLEVVKVPTATEGKSDYFVQTERTRLYAKVTTTLAEQVEQDLGSIVK